MSRLIDADKAILNFSDWMLSESPWDETDTEKKTVADTIKEAIRGIEEQPTVDAAPVVHAQWKDTKHEWVCTNCGTGYWSMNHRFKYCPECGAKMGEVTE